MDMVPCVPWRRRRKKLTKSRYWIILNAELEKPLEGKEETQQIHDRLVKLYAGLFLWWARLPPDVRAKSAIQPKWHYLPEMLGKDGITLTPDVGVEIKNRGTYGGIIRQNLLHKIGFGAALNKAGVTPEEKAWLDTLPLDSIRFDDLDQLFMQARNWTAENDRPKIELLVRLYQACRKIDKQMNSYSIHHAEEAREGIPKFATPGFLLAFERDYLPPGDIERCAGYKRLQEIICVARIIDDNITDKFYGAGPVIDQIKEVITKYPAVIDEIASEFAEVVLAEPKQTQKFCRILYALDNMTIWNDFVFTLNAKGGYLDFKHGKRYDIKFTIRWSGSHAAAFPIRPSTAESARAV
ncbi:MAG: hypothetical protein NTV07_06180 [Candidatus Omnitrophica bacterium]|nr:hypothetical protein [Candidatus Omnitrophota bacterium]